MWWPSAAWPLGMHQIISSNVTFVLAVLPESKDAGVCLKGRCQIGRSVFVSSSASGKCNLNAISGVLGIAFNLVLFWGA